MFFFPKEFNWGKRLGISPAVAGIVFVESAFQVGSRAGVEGVIGTPKNIDEPANSGRGPHGIVLLSFDSWFDFASLTHHSPGDLSSLDSRFALQIARSG